MSKNLITRIAVAAVCIPAVLWIIYQGGDWLLGMVILFALIGFGEFLVAEKISTDSFIFWLSYFAVAFILLQRTLLLTFFDDNNILNSLGGIIFFFLLIGMLISTFKDDPKILFEKYSRLLWGVIYIGLLYPYVYMIGYFSDSSNTFSGGDWLLLLFGFLWIGDTAAMFIGKAIGKHKLAPAVSPNKTVEGFIGGIIGAIVTGVILYYWKFSSIEWYHLIILAIGCSIFGQLGDLVESMWKRSLNIKDSSAIIPGHGGILDRFDSLLFAAPFMYFYINNFL